RSTPHRYSAGASSWTLLRRNTSPFTPLGIIVGVASEYNSPLLRWGISWAALRSTPHLLSRWGVNGGDASKYTSPLLRWLLSWAALRCTPHRYSAEVHRGCCFVVHLIITPLVVVVGGASP